MKKLSKITIILFGIILFGGFIGITFFGKYFEVLAQGFDVPINANTVIRVRVGNDLIFSCVPDGNIPTDPTSTPPLVATNTPPVVATSTPIPQPSSTPPVGSGSYTRAEVALHNTFETDCWIVVNSEVYDVSKSKTDQISGISGDHHNRFINETCGKDLSERGDYGSGFNQVSKHERSIIPDLLGQLKVGVVTD